MVRKQPSKRRRGAAGERLAQLDDLKLRIEQLVAGGEGLGRFEGIPIFVPRSAPGDLLRVRVVARRPDYGRAEILEVLEAGPGRRQPPCAFFERCGGCDLQHLEDGVQVELKARATRETLRRIGGLTLPDEGEVLAADPWAYRLRTQLHVRSGDRGAEVGYFARGTHDVVAINRCPVLVPELEPVLLRLPRILRDQQHRRVDLAAGDDGLWTSAPRIEGLPQGEVTIRVGEFEYAYDARCFFQGHRQLLPQLVDRAVGTFQGEFALELYSGVGLFSLPLARRYRKVIAIESERVAARFARNNARRNKIENLELAAQSVETWIRENKVRPDRILVDPPRTGLTRDICRILRRSGAERITYVSCHAATLARDLRLLTSDYAVDSLTLIDLFPQTGHMEAVVQLVRQSPEEAQPSKSSDIDSPKASVWGKLPENATDG